MKKTILIITVITAFSSCSTSYRIKSADSQEIDKGKIQQVSKIAEYRVETKKTKGSYSGIYKKSRPSYYIDLAKQIAIGNAITNGKCDFLIHPLFDIQVTGKQITCSVEGYPAHYTSFRTWNRMDSIPNGYAPVKTSFIETKRNKRKDNNGSIPKKKGRVLKTIGGIAAAVIVLPAIIGLATI